MLFSAAIAQFSVHSCHSGTNTNSVAGTLYKGYSETIARYLKPWLQFHLCLFNLHFLRTRCESEE